MSGRQKCQACGGFEFHENESKICECVSPSWKHISDERAKLDALMGDDWAQNTDYDA